MTNHENDVFFACSFIEFLGRETKNKRSDVVNTLGEDLIQKLHSLASVYHCENILQVRDDFIKMSGLTQGTFDNVLSCLYSVPDYYGIGYIYQSLVLRSMAQNHKSDDQTASVIISVFNSMISEKIQDFNSAWYYSNIDELFGIFQDEYLLTQVEIETS